MANTPTNLRMQAMIVLGTSSEPLEINVPNALYRDNSGNYPYIQRMDFTISSSPGLLDVVTRPASGVLKQSLSSVPVISQSELSQEYQELGTALSELTTLEEGDDWKIDASVYDAARYIAYELMTNSFPAPRIFNHGSKSVVFNWTNETNNLYLTISGDKISALISSPERIKRRIDYSAHEILNPRAALRSIQSGYMEQPIISTTKTTSDLFETLD